MSASSKKKLRKEQNAASMTQKQQKEMKEARKLKAYTFTFAVVMLLIVAIVVGIIVRAPIAGALDRGTNAVTINEHKLSITDLSYFYIDAVNKHYSDTYTTYYPYYGNYWSLGLGFSTSKPLNEQVYNQEEGTTWADYFIDKAMENAKSIYGLYDKAIADGHKLTEEEQTNLDEYLGSLDEMAQKNYSYKDAKTYLRAVYGDGANLETYSNYYKVSSLAASYYDAYADSLEYTDEDYRAHEKGNFNTYSSFTYAIYPVNSSTYLTGGTKDEDGKVTYSDKEKADALEAAKKDADALGAGEYKTVEKFDDAIKALAVNKDKKDVSSTLNEDVLYDKIGVTKIKQWIGNTQRQSGDVTVIPITQTKTNEDKSTTLETTGYYVVYFSERNNNEMKLVDVRHILVQFEGGTTNSQTGKVTYTDKEKAAAEKAAGDLLAEWKAGAATEDSFAELANKHSDDGDGTTGGLYEDVYPGQMVDNFNDWCFDESRKPGDTGTVQTEYGYHVMYYVGEADITYRDFMIKNVLISEDVNEWHEALVETVTLTKGNLSRMNWDLTLG